MAIGRSRFAPTSTTTTKGHSVLRQRSYNMPSRNLPPVTTPRSHAYTTRAEEYLLADRVSDANFVSNSLMDNNDSAAIRSRGRDQQLLKEATNAIVSSESYATPQTSVASRRVARGQSLTQRAASVPPRPLQSQVESSQVVTQKSTESQASRRPIIVLPPIAVMQERRQTVASAPSAVPAVRQQQVKSYQKVVSSVPSSRAQDVLPTASLQAHKVPRRFPTRGGVRPGLSDSDEKIRKTVTTNRVLSYPYAPAKPAPIGQSLGEFPKVYIPNKGSKPSNRSKAAIIASKLEPDPIKRRRPRSEYAANKYRELRRESQEKSASSGAYGSSERRRH